MSATSSSPGIGADRPSTLPIRSIQRPVCASETRTIQLPPVRVRFSSATMAPNAAR